MEILQNENIFIMGDDRAYHQDIRPLKIVILNLMPTKEATETQLLRLLANTPLQVEITLLHPESHESQHTSEEYLKSFYHTFSEIKHRRFDGMVITGAPIELLEFEEVTYWEELKEIMNWSKYRVTSTYHICWAAQAGLFYHYGIPKYPLTEKMFGVFPHHADKGSIVGTTLLRGFDDLFFVPHSRHTEVRRTDLEKVSELEILAESAAAGVYLVATRDGKQIFVTGHAEYDVGTLRAEYKRDVDKGLKQGVPKNYFPHDDPCQEPLHTWRSHANLLFSNWLNYYVYQVTPYDLETAK